MFWFTEVYLPVELLALEHIQAGVDNLAGSLCVCELGDGWMRLRESIH